MDSISVLRVIYECVDRANQMLPVEKRLEKTPDAVLAGEGSKLDSLALITFLVDLEEALRAESGVECSLLNEELLADSTGPFRSFKTLSDWIALQSH